MALKMAAYVACGGQENGGIASSLLANMSGAGDMNSAAYVAACENYRHVADVNVSGSGANMKDGVVTA